MKSAFALTVALFMGLSAQAQEEKQPAEKRYEFSGGEVFITSGEFREYVETPAGRKLDAKGRIQDIASYKDDIYLIGAFFIRKYDSAADGDETKKDLPFEKVFVYLYQLPYNHEILGPIQMPGDTARYYQVYLRSNKELPLEQQNTVFRGFVRVYPSQGEAKETRVQYLPYTELPKEGRWMLTRMKGNPKRMVFTITNQTTGEERLVGFVNRRPGRESEFSDAAEDIIPPQPMPNDPNKIF